MREEGYPPIRIKGQKITASKVNIPANVSSQYISALISNRKLGNRNKFGGELPCLY
jgi:5-enolpyruvylshikimate-3-phosphate synthase